VSVPAGIQPDALGRIIHPSARVGDAMLAAGVIVHAGAVIEDGCVLEAHAVVCEDTVLRAGVRVLPGAVLGRPPVATRAATRPLAAALPALEIGPGSVIGAHAVLYRGSRLAAEVMIGDLASLREECEVGERTLIARAVTVNYNTKIGARCKVMDLTHLTGNMLIEDEVFVSAGVSTANDNRMWRASTSRSAFGVPSSGAAARSGSEPCCSPGSRSANARWWRRAPWSRATCRRGSW